MGITFTNCLTLKEALDVVFKDKIDINNQVETKVITFSDIGMPTNKNPGNNGKAATDNLNRNHHLVKAEII